MNSSMEQHVSNTKKLLWTVLSIQTQNVRNIKRITLNAFKNNYKSKNVYIIYVRNGLKL